MYFVYILRTSSETLYVGQTNNLERRIDEHKEKSKKSSKYVRSFDSFELVHREFFETRSEAMRREAELKRMTKAAKEKFLKETRSKFFKEISDTDFIKNYKMGDVNKYSVRNAARGVVQKNGLVALLKVGKLGFYKLPGGGFKESETSSEAFTREVKEEIGYKCKILGELGTVIEWRDGFKLLQINYIFLSEALEDLGTLNLEDDEKAEGFKPVWVSPEDAKRLVSEGGNSDYESNFIMIRDLAILNYVFKTHG